MCTPTFSITTDRAGRVARVLARGELDLATAPALRGAVLDCLDDGPAMLALDLHAVTFIDCSGINAMVEMRKAVERSGSSIRLTNPSARVLRVLRLADAETLLAA